MQNRTLKEMYILKSSGELEITFYKEDVKNLNAGRTLKEEVQDRKEKKKYEVSFQISGKIISSDALTEPGFYMTFEENKKDNADKTYKGTYDILLSREQFEKITSNNGIDDFLSKSRYGNVSITHRNDF